MHVEQAPVIGFQQTDRRSTARTTRQGIAIPPRVSSHQFFVCFTKRPRTPRAGPASELPLFFSWQPVAGALQVVGHKIPEAFLISLVAPLIFGEPLLFA